MDRTTSKMSRLLLAVCGVAFALPSIFFTYYTVRLIYINLSVSSEEAAAHRSGGMLIGAIAFPVAAIIFGTISWFFISKARSCRHRKLEQKS